MELVVDIIIAVAALWTAHKAGAAYVLSYSDPERRRIAVLGTLVSAFMLAALIIRN